MSVVVVNDIKALYNVLEKFFNEYLLEIEKLKAYGLMSYLEDFSGDIYMHENYVRIAGGNVKTRGKFHHDVIPIKKLYTREPTILVLVNGNMLNTSYVITIDSPENIFYSYYNAGDKMLVHSIMFESHSYKVIKKTGIGKCRIAGKYVKDIVLRKTSDSEITGYISLDFANLEKSEFLKELATGHFYGQIEWYFAGVNYRSKIPAHYIKNIVGLHVVYLTDNIYDGKENLKNNAREFFREIIDRYSSSNDSAPIDFNITVTGHKFSFTVSITATLKKEFIQSTSSDIRIISRVKIDSDVGKIIVSGLMNK
jgi:hypothetical protein